MRKSIRFTIGGLGFALALSSTLASGADLITNGTFDDNIGGWVVGGTGGVDPGALWDSADEEASIGVTGTPGSATFSQAFFITPAASTDLSVSFDYTWLSQVEPDGDTFKVTVEYVNNSAVTVMENVLVELSNTASFGTKISFVDFLVPLVDLNATEAATISFMLTEVNEGKGTRIDLDNVVVNAVPIPAAAWLFGSSLIALFTIKRRRS